MAETAAKATATRTRRTTTPAKKTAAPAAAKAATEATPTETAAQRIPVELEHVGTTKSYEKFVVPDAVKEEHGVVGSLYAPIGTTAVKVLVLTGPAE
jgi:hypothetical protein